MSQLNTKVLSKTEQRGKKPRTRDQDHTVRFQSQLDQTIIIYQLKIPVRFLEIVFKNYTGYYK